MSEPNTAMECWVQAYLAMESAQKDLDDLYNSLDFGWRKDLCRKAQRRLSEAMYLKDRVPESGA